MYNWHQKETVVNSGTLKEGDRGKSVAHSMNCRQEEQRKTILEKLGKKWMTEQGFEIMKRLLLFRAVMNFYFCGLSKLSSCYIWNN